MGGRKRGKFERIHTDDEEEFSDNESIKSANESDEDESTEQVNENNSSSKSPKTGISESTADKFLITRSKRKYTKPERLVKNMDSTKIVTEEKSSQEANSKREIQIPVKKQRQTLKGLDSKIEKANSFLQELSQKITDREDEIKKLKTIIANDRVNETFDLRSKLDEKLRGAVTETNDELDRSDEYEFNFPLIGSDQSDEFAIEEAEEADKRRDARKKRSRSRSKSRDRTKRRRSRSRSRSRTIDNYRQDPMVQDLVKKMVAEQVQAEMNKRKQSSGNESGNYKVQPVKSPSDFTNCTIYTPAVPRNFGILNNDGGRHMSLSGTPYKGRR